MSSRASQRPTAPGIREGDADAGHAAHGGRGGQSGQGGQGGHDVDDAESRSDTDNRPTFERILPELIRRGFEVGRGPLEKVSESIFPKDLASQIASQLGDVRSGVVKAVAQEVGRFLRDADIASELRKVLTGMTIEAKVQLRFNQREDGSLGPKLDVKLEEPVERKKSR